MVHCYITTVELSQVTTKPIMVENLSFGDTTKVKISIVTACYKSELFLERIYRSILNLNYKNIEWIVVDDFSPDNTVERLYELKDRNEIPVNVLTLPYNTGGFGAARAGIAAATGKFTIILDHDDEILPDSISVLIRTWNALAPKNESLYGIWGRCMDENEKLLGRLYDEAPLICTNNYFFHILKCRVECFLMVDTQLLKKFYILSGKQVIKTNGSVWNEMGKNYRAIFTNEIARKYHTNVPNSQSSQKIHNPVSYSYQEAEYLNDNNAYFWKDASFFIKKHLLYLVYCYHAGLSIINSIKNLKHPNQRITAIALIPLMPLILLKNKFFNQK